MESKVASGIDIWNASTRPVPLSRYSSSSSFGGSPSDSFFSSPSGFGGEGLINYWDNTKSRRSGVATTEAMLESVFQKMREQKARQTSLKPEKPDPVSQ